MYSRLEAVIGQAHKVVANVDDEGARDRRRLDPLAVLVEDLEAAVHVLPEQREALQVRVRAEADVLAARRLRGRHGRVVVEDAVAAGVCGDGVKVRLGQVEREREDADESSCQADAFLPVGDAA